MTASRRLSAALLTWAAGLAEPFATRHETRAAAKLIRRDFGLSDVQDIGSLVDLVARRRGKPISLQYLTLPPRVSAFYFATPEEYFIVIDARANELTQLASIAHELGHILFDDAGSGTTEDVAGEPLPRELAQQLVPALNPDFVVKYLKRSHYESPNERKVEAFATVMLERHIALRSTAPDDFMSTFTHRRTGV
ncbi:ImmA/IrrE family metallo-endopeptidase [Streptomyces scabiei]|uniref:ImmA/IrrE family metallo-endopeptidase n=1 Tax=Streptomyces scabiei TaxID=1930 RepID=UPI003401E721